MNPELVRNLRLECSTHRLIAMPVVVGLLLAAAWTGGKGAAVALMANGVLFVLLILWGTRLAADSVLGEVADRTWDSQRMSAIGPWTMTWGKLFGSTVFVWYGALACLAMAVLAGATGTSGGRLVAAQLVAAGLLGQASALFFSLLLLRGKPRRLRLRVTLAQFLALAATLPFLLGAGIVFGGGRDAAGLSWYGMAFTAGDFVFWTCLVMIGWTILGCYRLMRVELQCRTGFLGWLAFTLFLAAYWAGLDVIGAADEWPFDGGRTLQGWVTAFLVTLVLTYAAAFTEPKGIVRLRQWLNDLRHGSLRRAATTTPSWLVSGVVCLACAANAILLLSVAAPTGLAGHEPAAQMIVALLLFALRDIALIYALTLDNRHQRGHLSALVYLTVLYALVPGLLAGAGAGTLVAVFLPVPGAPPLMSTVPVLLQALIALGLVAYKWRRLAQETLRPRTGQPSGTAAGPGSGRMSGFGGTPE